MPQIQSDSLSAERLLEHLRALSDGIGARLPASRAERRAAEYARAQLESFGLEDIRDQFFTSPETAVWSFAPLSAVGVVAALMGGRLGKLIGGLALIGQAQGLRAALRLEPPPYQPLIAQGTSQNVTARIAPSGKVERRVFLIAHLDSARARLALPLAVPSLTRPLNTLLIGLAAFAGLSMVGDALLGKRKVNGWQQAAAVASALGLATTLYDESRPAVIGANDDASGVAVLLGLAQALAAQPLAKTEVNLLFVGCEEAGAVGIEHYLRQYAPPTYNSAWIDVEMVGTGRLAYVTRQSLSAFDSLRSTPKLTALAAVVARENPALRINGREMTLMTGIAAAARRGYETITVAGYDDEGHAPNWRRTTDSADQIESDTLTRAAQYVSALIRAIDERGL